MYVCVYLLCTVLCVCVHVHVYVYMRAHFLCIYVFSFVCESRCRWVLMSDRPLNWGQEGDWSSGMIPALGAGGREFDSRITPSFFDPSSVSFRVV